MLKKKNIAMAMAVATVATSVAPAFAAVKDQNVDEATMISKVKEMLNTKYFGTEDSVYTIQIVGGKEVKEIKDLEAAIAMAKVEDKTVKLNITDKGHVVVNGRILDKVDAKYRLYSSDDLMSDVNTAVTTLTNKVVRSVAHYDADGNIADTNVVESVITLVNGTEIKLAVGDKKLDFTKAIDRNGNQVSLPVSTTEIGKQITRFETLETTMAEVTMPSKQLDSLVFNAKEDTKVEKNLSDLYNANGYTKEGKSFVDKVIAINGADTKQEIYNGKEYKVKKESLSNVKVNKEGKYELVLTLTVAQGDDTVDLAKKGKVVKIVITSDSNKDLNKVAEDMALTTGTVTEGKGKYKTLAGANRFETAIEISKESFAKHDKETLDADEVKASSVVLVGQDAIVDGLAAAPLAKQKKCSCIIN
ncbi:cell wall-binding repeat-containing protein [[Clostridium] dakarense]|uniref:cell wall-binding repeat-containing protein n=1 Tax=Faecalimicrobium dakarense TaxID=1301100 RepID=UPI0004BC5BA9|nr:cell wall-binding repeat-containing protein [[Clostridium] dakarense]